MIHKLKTVQPYFDEVDLGAKTFEVRKNDRNFKVGDFMVLQEWKLEGHFYTGNEIKTIITYILADEEYCKEGYVIIGFAKLC
jgi:ASC-1-like (ASCH) protein